MRGENAVSSIKNRRLVFLIFISGLVLLFSACGTGEKRGGVQTESIRDIIEKLVVTYGIYGDEAKEQTDAMLQQLSAADTDAGVRWKNVMAIWQSPDLESPMYYDALPDGLPDTEELCLVILGFQLNPDGTMQEELIRRLQVALESAEKYPHAYIVCTGGGTAAENNSATEAGEMVKWLEKHGIGKRRLITEERSLTTAQNAIFTYDILTAQYPDVRKLAIISSDYHIATGKLLFQAETILRADHPGDEKLEVISNAAWKAPAGSLSTMFQAGALIELSGDLDTAVEIYRGTYDLHKIPPPE